MAVGALEALGIVFGVGQWLVSTFENVDWILFEGLDIVVFVLGFFQLQLIMCRYCTSMGMFGEAIDNPLWHGCICCRNWWRYDNYWVCCWCCCNGEWKN